MADNEPTTPAPGQEPVAKVEAPAAPVVAVEPPLEVIKVEELSVQDLREIATQARSQAAAERVKRQEAAAEAAELKGRLAEAKSMDEVTAMANEYEAKLVKSNQAADRARAALAAGLPELLVDRIHGDDYDSMLADAQLLAEMTVKPAPQDPRNPSGGRSPGSDPKNEELGSGYKAAKRKHSF